MKKKCKGCRALQKKLLGIGYYCGLNHPIKAIAEIDGIPVEYKPLEECEKPNYRLLLFALRANKTNHKKIQLGNLEFNGDNIMHKTTLQYITVTKNCEVKTIGKSIIQQPKIEFCGGTIKWFNDRQLIKR